ncbi:UMP-CMP kinase [Piromyces finnis]|uniref:Uridylate kinase n=1 Tax=Piromyces finnis TaxID=1754191 RepID=A0A1Y1VFI2_9FUNG|nr:UMP-CMP kinase [Piromyces finnis]|eukprot:ORX54798.1 UMP-CMP kinase [Piromyces finnis]
MLSSTSCLLKNTAVANIAAPLNSKIAATFSSALLNNTKVSIRQFSLTPLHLEENKVEPPKNESTVEIPIKEAETTSEPPKEEPPKEEPPKTQSCSCNAKETCNSKNCCCKKAVLMLALAGIAGTAYYYYENRDQQTFGDDTTVVYVLGGPGAGKGTQCANLVKDFGFVHLSAGDLLREERQRKGSQYGELINNYIKEGKIVPANITIALLENAMAKSPSKRFLIDGFPRKMDQAKKFEKTVCKGKFVLFFDCPESVMLERLLKRGKTSGRVDDNIESIKKRFVTFKETSYPVVEYFEKQNKVKRVSCVNSPQKVYDETKAIFNELFKAEENAKKNATKN